MGAEYPDEPRLAVGGVVIKDDRVLLVRRGKPPAFGEWAIPGGSVELGESLKQARVRFHYVIIDLMGEYLSGEPVPASDATEAAWLTLAELKDRNINATTQELLSKLGFTKK